MLEFLIRAIKINLQFKLEQTAYMIYVKFHDGSRRISFINFYANI